MHPGHVRKIISGIGSLKPKKFDIQKAMQECAERMANDADIVEMMSQAGWKKAKLEYERMLRAYAENLRRLCVRTKANEYDIQRLSDLMQAMELWLDIVLSKPLDMQHTAKRQEKLRVYNEQIGAV